MIRHDECIVEYPDCGGLVGVRLSVDPCRVRTRTKDGRPSRGQAPLREPTVDAVQHMAARL